MATYQPSSPCGGNCYWDEARRTCLGCFRTTYDIEHWTAYNDGMRRHAIQQAFGRMEEFLIINQQFFNRETHNYDS